VSGTPHALQRQAGNSGLQQVINASVNASALLRYGINPSGFPAGDLGPIQAASADVPPVVTPMRREATPHPPVRLPMGGQTETDADRAADQALRQPTEPAAGGSPVPGPRGERRANGPRAVLATHSHLDALGPGRPMPAGTRARFEFAFGADLDGVRLHTGPAAATVAGALGAHAFTLGPHVVLGPGAGRLGASGDRLLAHELSHVVYQARVGSAAAFVQRQAFDPQTQPVTAARARDLSDSELAATVTTLDNLVHSQVVSMETIGVATQNLFILRGEFNRRRPGGNQVPPGGMPVGKVGVVAQVQPELRLRTGMDTSTDDNIIMNLPFNTRLQVLKRYPGGAPGPYTGDWLFVATSSGDMGYAAETYIRTDLPEPTARLHVVEAGRHGFAISIAERYYKEQAQSWGEDLRFYVNVLAWANGLHPPDTFDGWREVHFKGGDVIWIPGQVFARSLHGVVNSGSLSYNVADFFGIADLIKRIAELISDFTTAIEKSTDYLWSSIEKHIEKLLWDTLKGLASTLVVAVGLLAVTTAIGAALGALAGGVGAAPGAAAGFEVGMALLEWLGLGMLVVWVGQSIIEVGGAFGRFLGQVWNARGDAKKLDAAAFQFAEAVAILLAKLLEALVMYISAKGMPKAMESLRGTKFGEALGKTESAKWLAERAANVSAGKSPLKSPSAVFRPPAVGEVQGVPADVTYVENPAPFHALPRDRLPGNLPPGHQWARSASNEWVIVRDPAAPPVSIEITVYSDGTNTNYVIRANSRMIASDTLTNPNPTYSGRRLPEELSGTGADNPYRDPATGRLYDKSHGTDYADTLEGPNVRNSSTDPSNFTPGASWWNRGPRNALVQRIRTIGGGYREMPLYDANPPLTANGTPIPREFVFVETNRMGQPQNAWRIPNDPTLTDRSLGALNGRDIPISQVPAAMLQPNVPVVPDGPGVTYLPGLIIGHRGDDE
jgi:hypothetical protein